MKRVYGMNIKWFEPVKNAAFSTEKNHKNLSVLTAAKNKENTVVKFWEKCSPISLQI